MSVACASLPTHTQSVTGRRWGERRAPFLQPLLPRSWSSSGTTWPSRSTRASRRMFWFESQRGTHAAAAYAFASKLACCSKLELTTSCSQRLFKSPSHQTTSPVFMTSFTLMRKRRQPSGSRRCTRSPASSVGGRFRSLAPRCPSLTGCQERTLPPW